MASATLKLSLAASVSAFGWAATTHWYRHSAPSKTRRGGVPIAYVESGAQDTQRKPNKRLVWEPLQKGESLYSLDTVRAEGVATRLRMVGSDAMIDLEAQSVIVLSQTAGKVSLDLLNGGMFVKNDAEKDGKKSTLEVKIGGTKLATGSKDLAMSVKRDQQGRATVAVSKGDVSAQTGTKSFAVVQGKAGSIGAEGSFNTDRVLQVLSPAADAVIDIGTAGPGVVFRWQKTSAAMQVAVEVQNADGTYRQLAQGPGDSGALSAKLAVGMHLWRLVATTAGSANSRLESLSYKLRIVSVGPPELVQPVKGSNLVLEGGKVSIPLLWEGGDHFVSYQVSVYKDAETSPTLARGSREPSTVIELTQPGRYTWQVSGRSSLGERVLTSAVGTFVVTNAVNLSVKPVMPADRVSLPGSSSGATTQLTWDADAAITSFRLQVESKEASAPLVDASVKERSYRVTLPAAGVYEWRVRAEVAGSAAPWSKPRTIIVAALAKLNWSQPDTVYEYDSKNPTLKLAWSGANGPGTRVGISADSGFKNVKWQASSAGGAELQLAKDGTYYVKVQRVDGEHVTAETPLRKIEVRPAAVLPTPGVIGMNEGKITATGNGNVELRWASVPKARAYQVTLINASGETVFKKTTKDTTLRVTDLIPGSLRLQIATYNSRSVLSPPKDLGLIEVPSIGTLRPPTTRAVRIR